MVRTSSQYGLERGLGGNRSIAYDQYAEMARQTRAAQANLVVNAAQTAIMAQVRDSLGSLAGVMDEVRKHQADALAIQQELLQRDQVQSFLEEFIYSTEKLVAECQKKDCGIPLSSRYFLLNGVVKTVEQEGISTPVIRGRDNKSAFETTMASVADLISKLKTEEEVKEAIAWSEKERQKREEAAEQARREKQRQQQEAQQELAKLTQRRDQLVAQKSTVNWSEIQDWVKEKHQQHLSHKSMLFKYCVYSMSFPFGLLLPVWFYLEQMEESKKKDKDLNIQIDELNTQIAIKSSPDQST